PRLPASLALPSPEEADGAVLPGTSTRTMSWLPSNSYATTRLVQSPSTPSWIWCHRGVMPLCPPSTRMTRSTWQRPWPPTLPPLLVPALSPRVLSPLSSPLGL
ncbi:hypothetical protein HK405_013285, partial [Cladochytrium tenue]